LRHSRQPDRTRVREPPLFFGSTVVQVAASHSVLLSQREAVAEIIRTALKETAVTQVGARFNRRKPGEMRMASTTNDWGCDPDRRLRTQLLPRRLRRQ
jgi:hypothetical protein